MAGTREQVLAMLQRAAAAALPGDSSAAAGLQRIVLRNVLEIGLAQHCNGGFELQAAPGTRLGEKVLTALPAAAAAERQLYGSPSHKLRDLLERLQEAGILAATASVNLLWYIVVQPSWLQQVAAAATVAPAAAAAQAAGSSTSNATWSVEVELPVSLQEKPVYKLTGVVDKLLRQSKDAAVRSLHQILALRFVLPPSQDGKSRYSWACAGRASHFPTHHLPAGEGEMDKSRVQLFALGSLLRLGLAKVGPGRVRQDAVLLTAAAAHLRSSMETAANAASLLSTFSSRYGGLLAVLSEPACAALVQLVTVGGEQHVLLRIDRLPGTVGGSVPPQPSAALLPLPVPLCGSAAGGSGSAAAARVATPPAVESLAAQLGKMQLAAGPPAARLVTSQAAAAAAVNALLAAPAVAMDCEGALERGGSIALIQLYAPGYGDTAGGSGGSAGAGSSPCYVFDLHAMAPSVRGAAVRQLARLLESPSVVKVGGGGGGVGASGAGEEKAACLHMPTLLPRCCPAACPLTPSTHTLHSAASCPALRRTFCPPAR